jgi:hypothetical protein
MTSLSVRSLRCWLLLIALVAVPTGAQGKGRIEGTVTNELGKPVSKAKVHAAPMSSRPQASIFRFEETDENGHFSIDQLDWGEYVLGAMKTEDGYPFQLNKLYINTPLPRVTLTPQEPVGRVQIQFAWKAALLTGRVTDATTGTPLQTTFKLSRKPDSMTENYLTSASEDYSVLLPPDTLIYISVYKVGYKTWYFGGGSDPSRRSPHHLGPGERMNLDIALEPDPLASYQNATFVAVEMPLKTRCQRAATVR